MIKLCEEEEEGGFARLNPSLSATINAISNAMGRIEEENIGFLGDSDRGGCRSQVRC